MASTFFFRIIAQFTVATVITVVPTLTTFKADSSGFSTDYSLSLYRTYSLSHPRYTRFTRCRLGICRTNALELISKKRLAIRIHFNLYSRF